MNSVVETWEKNPTRKSAIGWLLMSPKCGVSALDFQRPYCQSGRHGKSRKRKKKRGKVKKIGGGGESPQWPWQVPLDNLVNMTNDLTSWLVTWTSWLGTHEAVSWEGHEWGGQNGLLAKVILGYDLIDAHETGCQLQCQHWLQKVLQKPSRMRVVNGHLQ